MALPIILAAAVRGAMGFEEFAAFVETTATQALKLIKAVQ
jgi:hypothetical protein